VRLAHLLQLSPAAALLVDVAADEDADEAVAARLLHPVFALLSRAIPKR